MSMRFFFFLILSLAVFGVACSKKGSEPPALTAERKAEFDTTFNSLKLNVDISEYNRVFGEPALTLPRTVTIANMVVRRHAPPRKVEESFSYIEHLYVNPYFYVQVLTDEAGKVGMYSITARTAGYAPTINTVFGHPISLGKSVYEDLQAAARKIGADFTKPEQNAYYEILVTNAEEPEIAVAGTNPLGYVEKVGNFPEKSDEIFVKWFLLTGTDFPMSEEHDTFRKNTTINTYSRAATWCRGLDNTGGGTNLGAASIHIGPSPAQLASIKK
ncbi:MAG: hypothetical protein NVV73_01240 [Cellvibrionaceae bacterium]|nr:hypothetical protein [Cellvibrionaceae bacterium]